MVQYSAQEDGFRTDSFDVFFDGGTEKIVHFIEAFLQANNFHEGLEIDFLCEMQPGHGFAFSSVISALLVYLMQYLIDSEMLQIGPTGEMSAIPEMFDQLHKLSLELSNCMSEGKNIGGSSNYAVML